MVAADTFAQILQHAEKFSVAQQHEIARIGSALVDLRRQELELSRALLAALRDTWHMYTVRPKWRMSWDHGRARDVFRVAARTEEEAIQRTCQIHHINPKQVCKFEVSCTSPSPLSEDMSSASTSPLSEDMSSASTSPSCQTSANT